MERNNETICKCGNRIHQNPMSTIKKKLCPKCELARQRAKQGVGSIISKKTIKDTTLDRTISKKPKKLSKDFYRTTAWSWCRKYVLLYYANKDGIVKCATSGRLMRIGTPDCHCGHYIKVRDGNSTNYATAFQFANLAPQSRQDNTFMGGRQDLMREFLVKQHGEENIKDLERQRNIPYRLDDAELKYWADWYKFKYKHLLEQRGMKDPWKR